MPAWNVKEMRGHNMQGSRQGKAGWGGGCKIIDVVAASLGPEAQLCCLWVGCGAGWVDGGHLLLRQA